MTGMSSNPVIRLNLLNDGKVLETVIPRTRLRRYSPAQFAYIVALGIGGRIFKQVHVTTFQEYVLRRRISQAIRLLLNPSASVTDACYMAGFNDQSDVSRIFRRYLEASPSIFRKN
jgi:hypothetical protein